MIVLFPGSRDDEGTGEDEADAPAFEDAADAVEGICRTDRLFAASPSSLTLAGGAAICLGSYLDRFPLGLAVADVDGRFLFSWEDILARIGSEVRVGT